MCNIEYVTVSFIISKACPCFLLFFSPYRFCTKNCALSAHLLSATWTSQPLDGLLPRGSAKVSRGGVPPSLDTCSIKTLLLIKLQLNMRETFKDT